MILNNYRIGDVKLRSKSDASALHRPGNPLVGSSSTGSIKEALSAVDKLKERETKPRSDSGTTSYSFYI